MGIYYLFGIMKSSGYRLWWWLCNMWIKLMPKLYIKKNGKNGKLCHIYFTIKIYLKSKNEKNTNKIFYKSLSTWIPALSPSKQINVYEVKSAYPHIFFNKKIRQVKYTNVGKELKPKHAIISISPLKL